MSEITYPAWMGDSLCAQTDPELFFPTVGGTPGPAIAVCNICPVKAECREYALGLLDGTSGVWGGLAPGQLRKMRRARQKGAAA